MIGKNNTVTKQLGRHMMNFQDFIIALSKAHGLKAFFSLSGAFVALHLLPIAHFLAIGVLLVLCDWVTGVWAAINRKEKITSKGLRRTVGKVLLYSLAIVLVMVVETTFFESNYLVAVVALYISIVELFSNLENISSITGRNIIGVVRTTLFVRFPFLKKIMNVENNKKTR